METAEDGAAGGLRQPLIDIAIESWRFARLFARVIGKLEDDTGGRYVGQLRYFMKRVDDSLGAAGLRVVSLEGLPYDPGMAASALNIGDFGPDDLLVVDQMVEPVLMGTHGVVKSGTLMLKRVE